MLKLDLSNQPTWLDLGHGVHILAAPMTTALMVAARNDPDVRNLQESASDEESGMVFARALARIAVVDWEGVGDANGEAIPVGLEAIDALMDVFPIFEAFQTLYVSKGMMLESEKNASSSLPSGSSAGAGNTAKRAKRPVKNARKS